MKFHSQKTWHNQEPVKQHRLKKINYQLGIWSFKGYIWFDK